jgi:hypothetical protein
MMRLVAVLLTALAFGFCAPEPSEAADPRLPGILSADAQLTSACDDGRNQLGTTTNAKTSAVALSADYSDIQPAAPEPSATAAVRAQLAPDHVALDAPACRAPPLA